MSDFTIRTSPEALTAASEYISKKAALIETVFSELRTKVQKTSSFWTGDAADLHRSLFEEQLPAMESVVSRFKGQAASLQQIANNYAEGKNFAVTTVEDLPDDVIS